MADRFFSAVVATAILEASVFFGCSGAGTLLTGDTLRQQHVQVDDVVSPRFVSVQSDSQPIELLDDGTSTRTDFTGRLYVAVALPRTETCLSTPQLFFKGVRMIPFMEEDAQHAPDVQVFASLQLAALDNRQAEEVLLALPCATEPYSAVLKVR